MAKTLDQALFLDKLDIYAFKTGKLENRSKVIYEQNDAIIAL